MVTLYSLSIAHACLHACMFAVTGRCWAHRLGLAACVILVLLRTAWFYNHPHCPPSITQELGNSNLPYFSHFSTHPLLFSDDLSFNPPPHPLCNTPSSVCPFLLCAVRAGGKSLRKMEQRRRKIKGG